MRDRADDKGFVPANALSSMALKQSGVRRVNNLPIYIGGGVLALFVGIIALVASDRAAQKNRSADNAKGQGGNTEMFADQIAGNRKDGMIRAESEEWAVVPELPVPTENSDLPPLPAEWSRPPPEQDHDAMERGDQMRRQKFEEAVHAKTAVQISLPNRVASGGGSAGNDATRANHALALPGTLQKEQEDGADHRAGASVFAQSDRWKLDAQLEAPHSPYVLRAGFVMPAMLISGINADLPGQIIAQLAQNVYDTPTGKYLLVPQGARLIGSYSSDIAYGQSRVLVAWQRIVFPDGKALDIGKMPGSDGAGYSGFKDRVNNHYFRLFSSALLMSAVTAGVNYSQRPNRGHPSSEQQELRSVLGESLGQQLGQVAAQMITKHLNISPTLEIRPGFRFNVIVTKDMTFSKPYQSFDYQSSKEK